MYEGPIIEEESPFEESLETGVVEVPEQNGEVLRPPEWLEAEISVAIEDVDAQLDPKLLSLVNGVM